MQVEHTVAPLCGWLGLDSVNDARAQLDRMLGCRTSALPGEGRIEAHPEAALACETLASEGDVMAAMVGEPRWLTAELAELARERGNAAALLAAYRRAGTELCQLFGNSFAAAIVDRSARRVLLAIDRMGIQPLAYAEIPGKGLVFGTSCDQVIQHAWVDARLDPQSLFNYVFFHMVPSPATVFTQVRKLAPAELLEYRDGKVSVRRHWIPRFANGEKADLQQLSRDVHTALQDAISEYAKQPHVGAFLSGGLDSSTVSGMLARLAGRRVSTYSIGFDQQGFDEMHYARITARHFDIDGREYYVTPEDVAQTLPRVATTFDEPFGNSSALPAFLCAKFARETGVTHMLAGDGGDEIFGGNERYAKQKIFEVYQLVPRVVRERVLNPWALNSNSLQSLWPAAKLRSYIKQATVPMPERLQTWNFMWRTGAANMFEPDFLRQVDQRAPLDLMAATYHEAPTQALVDRMLYYDWKFTLADNDLRKVGRMCELAGVQVSYPMIDDRLIDVSLRVPPEQKVRRLELRHFYKQTMKDFLPREVIEKTKHGFGLPFGHWVKSSPALQAVVHPALDAIQKRGIVRPAFIESMMQEFRTDPDANYYGPIIWVLTVLEHWLQSRRL